MTDRPTLTNADALRAWTADQWQSLVTLTDALPDDLWEGPTDTAGWTVKDHVAHVSAWDESLIGLVRDGVPRQQTLQVPDEIWETAGYDAENEVIRQQTVGTPVAEVKRHRDEVWREIETLLASLDDETIARPGAEFGLDYGRNETFLETLVDDLGVHYDQHRGYIQTILDLHAMTDPAAYRAHVAHRWQDYLAFLDGLTPAQWVEPTDAAGWTVKDHVAHVTAWDTALVDHALGRRPMRESLDMPEELWTGGVDPINEAIRERSRLASPADILAEAHRAIESSRAALETLDLAQPARDVNLAPPDDERTLLDVFVGDQAEHYEEHRAYMRRIIDAAAHTDSV